MSQKSVTGLSDRALCPVKSVTGLSDRVLCPVKTVTGLSDRAMCTDRGIAEQLQIFRYSTLSDLRISRFWFGRLMLI